MLLFCMLTLHAQEVYKTVKDLPYIAKSETDAYRKERCKLDVYYPVDKKDFPITQCMENKGKQIQINSIYQLVVKYLD